MNIADDETIPKLSGKDLSIDLKGTGAETFKVNSGGQVFIRSNTYTGNNGIHIESTQGGVQIKSNKTLDLDGSSELVEIHQQISPHKLVDIKQIRQQFSQEEYT